jgi:tRNA pseudouridine38-40 synthase
MNNYIAVVEYDGTDFKGFQNQPGRTRTVQGELEKALSVLLGEGHYHNFSYAGRTDTGVHAKHQVINFETAVELNLYKFKWQLNCLLPDDISVKDIAADREYFDSRKSAKKRQYSYFVVNNNFHSVFLKKYSLLVVRELDVQLMKKAAGIFTGIHDFRSFCSSDYGGGSTVRRIYSFRIKPKDNGLIVFEITANSFLYNMVRIIVGTILEVGKGERKPETIVKALEGRDRKLAGKVAPAKGLFLTGVFY